MCSTLITLSNRRKCRRRKTLQCVIPHTVHDFYKFRTTKYFCFATFLFDHAPHWDSRANIKYLSNKSIQIFYNIISNAYTLSVRPTPGVLWTHYAASGIPCSNCAWDFRFAASSPTPQYSACTDCSALRMVLGLYSHIYCFREKENETTVD